MSIKTQIKQELRRIERYELEHRSAFERAGALALTALTMFSLMELTHTHGNQQYKRDAIMNSPYAINSARENETMRLPVKLDDGLRATATTGE